LIDELMYYKETKIGVELKRLEEERGRLVDSIYSVEVGISGMRKELASIRK